VVDFLDLEDFVVDVSLDVSSEVAFFFFDFDFVLVSLWSVD
jgi:hypothetical protein